MSALGDELAGLLGEIKARLGNIEDQQKEERLSASQHRQDLRIIIASQSAATLALTARVDNLAEDFKEVRELALDYRDAREQAKGAAKAVFFFRSVVVGLAATVAAIITWIISVGHGR